MKLFRILSTAICLIVLSAACFAQKPEPTPPVDAQEEKEVLRISSDLILVDAIVVDRDGKQVTNLSAGDFEVLQDGKPQKIVNFGYVNAGSGAGATSNDAAPVKPDKKSLPLPPVGVRSNRGRIITFVIDDGNCLASPESLELARDAMKKFIREQMLPDDKVAIYRTRGGSSLLQMYSSNREILTRNVNKINWMPSACGSAFDPVKNDSTFKTDRGGGSTGKGSFESSADKEFREDNQNYERENQVIGTVGVLNFVVERLKSLPQRKIVFFLSDGIQLNSDPRAPTNRGVEALREVSDKASRASVVIYTMSNKGLTVPGFLSSQDDIDPGITGGTDKTDEARQDRIEEERSLNDGLSYLAYATGGEFIRNKNFLDASIKTVLEKENGYYLIGYQPEDETFNGKDFHKIEVRLLRPELRVSSRKYFFGRADQEAKQKNKTAETPLYQAIASPLQASGIDLRLTTIVGNDADEGNFIRAIFHVKGEDITLGEDADGGKKALLDVVAVTLDEKGKVVEEFNRTYPIRIPKQGVATVLQNGLDFSTDLPVKKSGVYSFRIAVRDNNSKRVGSAGDFVEIPDWKKGAFFMSGLLTTTITSDGKPLLPKNRPANAAFAPVFITEIPSIRQYKAGGVLAYAYNVYNAKLDAATNQPKLTTLLRLYKDGKVLVEGKETPAQLETQKDWTRIQDYGLFRLSQNAAPGEYILQIAVRDTISGKTDSQWIDFEIVP